MKHLRTISLLLFIAAVLSSACTKEKQDVTQVEQETMISQGGGVIETAQRGPNGTNVIFSNWITKTNDAWTGFGTSEITTDINTSSLTDAIRNQGMVLVYMEYPNNRVYLLPFVRLEFNLVYDYSFITGKITLSARIVGSIIVDGMADLKFRYVLIPSSSFGNTGSGRMNKQVDYKNYNAVCEYYGIPK
jgi:hypothetical protein